MTVHGRAFCGRSFCLASWIRAAESGNEHLCFGLDPLRSTAGSCCIRTAHSTAECRLHPDWTASRRCFGGSFSASVGWGSVPAPLYLVWRFCRTRTYLP